MPLLKRLFKHTEHAFVAYARKASQKRNALIFSVVGMLLVVIFLPGFAVLERESNIDNLCLLIFLLFLNAWIVLLLSLYHDSRKIDASFLSWISWLYIPYPRRYASRIPFTRRVRGFPKTFRWSLSRPSNHTWVCQQANSKQGSVSTILKLLN